MELKKGSNRFYIIDGNNEIGEVTFTEDQPSVLSINHTYVDPKYRGQHIAQKLIQAVVDLAISEQKQVSPICSYAKVSFERNQEYQRIQYRS
ncbi:N-acetyltransferase [Sporolactobacillus shoreicorticis]|uniref:GNAT family N-acetyltransferase n=1 Tax=Sporolactobacillus shoreicorticis TaxID=1923877 RepID=A0ABW5RZN6_9BACL|nr:GNAT family N-acetyltransferase [Sporolactobacillus shoreicorticis]MCO7126976.1 N-acetyltransferase [Sporolactobacillus shoreicorticis]